MELKNEAIQKLNFRRKGNKSFHNKTHIIRYRMNCTPKVRQKKSNFCGVFIMKLTYDDKVQIYELRIVHYRF